MLLNELQTRPLVFGHAVALFQLLDFRQPRDLGEFLESRNFPTHACNAARALQLTQHRAHCRDRGEDDPVRVDREPEAETAELIRGKIRRLPTGRHVVEQRYAFEMTRYTLN